MVLEVLTEERFADKAPETVYAMLLDEDRYLCSVRTMYRLLNENGLVKERRNVARHRKYAAPELEASQPNQVWCWDVTKMRGPKKGQYYYLYSAIDIYSRYIVGWTVANHESAGLAREFIEQMYQKQGINADTLIVHSDRGAAMTSKTLKQLYDELHIKSSFSRPRVSNDNPFVESFFKTIKYSTKYPKRFRSQLEAMKFCRSFFDWYNKEHRHSGIAFMTPHTVHNGNASQCAARRQTALDSAFNRNPERHVKGKPKADSVPNVVYINPPADGTICGAKALKVDEREAV